MPGTIVNQKKRCVSCKGRCSPYSLECPKCLNAPREMTDFQKRAVAAMNKALAGFARNIHAAEEN